MAKVAKTVWGIDVGNCTLKALKIGLTDDGVEVLNFSVIEYGKILTQPEIEASEKAELIDGALERFLEEHDTRHDAIVISVPGQSSFTRFIKLPPVEKKRVDPAQLFIHVQPQMP